MELNSNYTKIKEFGYLDDILEHMANKSMPKGIELIEINQDSPRLSGKTMADLIFMGESLFLPDVKVVGYGIRLNVQDAEQLFQEMLQVLDLMQVRPFMKINLSNRTITWKKSQLIFIGLLSNVKTKLKKSDLKVGMKSAGNADYVIRFIDERHQLHKDLVNAVDEAIRGYKWLIQIEATNPWSITNDYIQYLNKWNPYTEWERLINTPNSYKDSFKQYVSSKTLRIFHRVHWENNTYLSIARKEKLREGKLYDPIRARISVDGMYGIIDGGIYTDYIAHIKDIKDLPMRRVERYVGGLDWGLRHSTTAAVLIGIGYNAEFVVGIDMYKHSNKDSLVKKTNLQMCNEVVEFYIALGEDERFGKHLKKGLQIEVDYAATGIIEALNEITRQRDAKWLYFVECVKFPINKRIDCVRFAMSKGALYLDMMKMQELFGEFELSVWDDTKTSTEPVRLDDIDDAINAFEYAIARVMFELIRGYEELFEWQEKEVK